MEKFLLKERKNPKIDRGAWEPEKIKEYMSSSQLQVPFSQDQVDRVKSFLKALSDFRHELDIEKLKVIEAAKEAGVQISENEVEEFIEKLFGEFKPHLHGNKEENDKENDKALKNALAKLENLGATGDLSFEDPKDHLQDVENFGKAHQDLIDLEQMKIVKEAIAAYMKILLEEAKKDKSLENFLNDKALLQEMWKKKFIDGENANLNDANALIEELKKAAGEKKETEDGEKNKTETGEETKTPGSKDPSGNKSVAAASALAAVLFFL